MDFFLRTISPKKYNQIKKFYKKADFLRALLAEIMIRGIICKKFCINNEKIEFVNTRYGKPYLKNNNNFHFNISHSGDWIVCAIDEYPVGIDIELIQPINLSIAERFFSSEEYSYIISSPIDKQLSLFYDIWTLKECYIKMIGKGLSISLNSFSIKTEDEKTYKHKEEDGAYFFMQYEFDQQYKLSVCASKNSFSKVINIQKIHDLKQNLKILPSRHKML